MLAPQICLNPATYRLAAYEDNTVIYKNGAALVTLNRGDLNNQTLTLGDRLTSSKPFYGLNNSSDPYTNALASEAMADTRWFMMVNRYDNQTVQIYPLADGNANYTFSTTHIDDEDVTDGSATTSSLSLTGGTVTTLTLSYTGSAVTYFNLSSDVPVMIFKKGVSGDGALLMPTDIEIYSRLAGTPVFTTTTTDSQGNNVSYTSLGGGAYSSDDGIRKMAAFGTADGSGGDAEGHIGRSALGDEYVLPCAVLDNYWLISPDDCIVTIKDNSGTVLTTQSLTAYTDLEVGTATGSGAVYTSGGPFYFSGTKPFALQAQVDDRADEEMHYGFRRDLKPRYGLEAVTEILQSSVTDLEGNQTAAITLRAKAGTGGAELELVAADNVSGGSVSTARIDADNIILDGTVTADAIQANAVTAEKIQVSQSTTSIYSTVPTSSSSGSISSGASGMYFNGYHNRIEIWDSGVLRVLLGDTDYIPSNNP